MRQIVTTLAILVVLAIVLVVSNRCNAGSPVGVSRADADALQWIDEGNMTYVYRERDGNASSNAEMVMSSVSAWEKKYPTRELISFQVLERQNGYAVTSKTFGVLVYSRTRGE
jgi:hypothetical protein